jgi:hypothetical protein
MPLGAILSLWGGTPVFIPQSREGVCCSAVDVVVLQAHFARANNLADVASKESSQETAVTLLGLTCGVAVASYTSVSPAQSWAVFLALTALHVYANWWYVLQLHALCFA